MIRTELVSRILRDISDGVLVLDLKGRIVYLNPQGEGILGSHAAAVGSSYLEVFLNTAPHGKENDEFHQFVLDAVYQKDKTHGGTVPFVDSLGNRRFVRVTSSFLKDDENGENIGVVLVISDVTETERLKRKRHDAAIVFGCVTACICAYLLLISTLEFLKISAPTKLLTQVINAMVFVVALIIYRKTDFSREELGLKLTMPRFTLVSAALISMAIVAALALGKVIISKASPGTFDSEAPFWNWNIGIYSWVSYLFTSVVQEFLARSMIYGSIRKMFDGSKGVIAAIVLSSLLFGAVHIAHGFVYMMASIILLGALGGLYEKQRNIWGVAIIHYVLGQAANCLGFFALG